MKPTYWSDKAMDTHCAACKPEGSFPLSRLACGEMVEGFGCGSPNLECAKCSTILFDIVADGDLEGEDLARYTHG